MKRFIRIRSGAGARFGHILCLMSLFLAACGGGGEDPEPATCSEECGPNQTCQGTACVCLAGFKDCDGDASNGCEHQGPTCPSECTPEDDDAFCERLGKQCGQVSGTDNCDNHRLVGCGSCPGGESCGEDGLCHVVCAESDEAFCERLGKECGTVAETDACGVARTVSCGTCTDGKSCGEDNVCQEKCVESDAAFCERHGKECGNASGTDLCGVAREVKCGNCGPGTFCDAGVCACQPESDPGLCVRLGKGCGTVEAPDNCGVDRTVNCGSCRADEACGEDNVCHCVGESDADFCERLGKECGSVTAKDNCNATRTVSCGTCGGDGEVCSSESLCCLPETDATFCERLGKNCGEVSAKDNCGITRTVTDCGACTEEGEVCNPNNTCGPPCVPMSDEELCLDSQASCGELTVVDNCGVTRTVGDCGVCAGEFEVCAVNSCIEPDGMWLDQICDNLFFPCATGLLCVGNNARPFGSCKLPCFADEDCVLGGSCYEGFLTSGAGICGNLLPVGSPCVYWMDGPDLCFDAAHPPGSGSYLDCFDDVCTFLCDFEFRTPPTPQFTCPSGTSCGTVWHPSDEFGQDLLYCE